MTDKAVSALTSLTGANTATGDLLYIVDISEASAADRSKKITAQELQNYIKGFPATIGVGGATPAASGAGVSFPASISASSDANTLDDYEEGTYTPTFTAESGTAPAIGNGTLTGRYTKVGRQVNVDIYLFLGSTTTMGDGGVLRFGLPFTAAAALAANVINCGTAYIDDTGTGWTVGFPIMRGNTYVDISFAAPGTIGTSRLTNAAPMTWVNGDSMVISFSFAV